MFASENQIKFDFGSTELVSRLIEGQYPDYKRIIPENFSTKIKVAKEDFSNAIKTSSLFSQPDTNEINIETMASLNQIKITAESRQVGSSSAVISAEIEGENEKITFNCQYILEGLSCFPTSGIFLMIRRPPRSTPLYSSAASDVYKRQVIDLPKEKLFLQL